MRDTTRWEDPQQFVEKWRNQILLVCVSYIDGLVQERRNSSALAMSFLR